MGQEEIYSIILNHANSRLENKAIESLYKQFYHRAKSVIVKNGLDEEYCKSIFNDSILKILLLIRTNQWVFQEDGLKRFILRYCRFKSLSLSREKKKFTYNIPFDLHYENDETSDLDQEKLLEKVFEIVGDSGAKILKDRFILGQSYIVLGESKGITANSYKNNIYRQLEKIRKQNINLDNYLSS